MSILASIVSKILGHHGTAAPVATSNTAAPSPAGSGVSGAPASDVTRTPPTATGAAAATPPASGKPSVSIAGDVGPGARSSSSPVDVAAMLNGLAAQHSERLDWKHSIVDMMKLLGLDSSLTARQALAQELHYSGDMRDSAAMNLWLHKQVMVKVAENGGVVPADLRT